MLVVGLPSSLSYYTRFFSRLHRTNVGHGPVRTLFLSLFLFLVPDPNYIMLYWLSANLLVCMMVWPGWGATNTISRGSTRGLCALEQK